MPIIEDEYEINEDRAIGVSFLKSSKIYEILDLDITKRNIKEYKVLMEFIGAQMDVSDCQIKKLFKKYCFFRACRMNPRLSHIPSELIYCFFDAKDGSN